jgi:glycolate oxidase FAD binding subunit
MSAVAETVSLKEKTAPADQSGVADAVRAAYEARRAVNPLGGGTALNYGNTPAGGGMKLDLAGLNRIVDYTPRDMTILVEAGMRMAELAETLATENQHLPVDVPRAAEATIGGVVATNWNGPRRFGHGTIRDYVIGIHAVDGRGIAFQGGGRVVKNVAGYDFCKLLTGSLGTLAVITQLALKVTPKPESSAVVLAMCSDLPTVERMLTRLAKLPVSPVAIDLLIGSAWELDPNSPGSALALVVRVEGTQSEVSWLAEQVQYELLTGGGANVRRLEAGEADSLWARQVEFSDRGPAASNDESPMVVKICVPPSAVTKIAADLLDFDAGCRIQAHAGNGIVLARFSRFGHADLTKTLVGSLRPAAVGLGGSLTVVSNKLEGITPHIVWGGRTKAIVLMERVKQKFDPRNILNPGRFAY